MTLRDMIQDFVTMSYRIYPLVPGLKPKKIVLMARLLNLVLPARRVVAKAKQPKTRN